MRKLDKRSDSMHVGRSITDELRRFIEDPLLGYAPQDQHIEILTEIADRIDAEHEAKVSYWQGASYKDGYDEGFASADDWLAQHEDAMAEHGWVKLPVDADGEVVRVGERVQLIGNDPSTVSHMSLAGDGWRVYVKYDGDLGTGSGEPSRIRHHRAPTVEDVLRDVVTLCHNTWKEESPFHFYDVDDVMKSGNIAEYASRLRLAGDAE